MFRDNEKEEKGGRKVGFFSLGLLDIFLFFFFFFFLFRVGFRPLFFPFFFYPIWVFYLSFFFSFVFYFRLGRSALPSPSYFLSLWVNLGLDGFWELGWFWNLFVGFLFWLVSDIR